MIMYWPMKTVSGDNVQCVVPFRQRENVFFCSTVRLIDGCSFPSRLFIEIFRDYGLAGAHSRERLRVVDLKIIDEKALKTQVRLMSKNKTRRSTNKGKEWKSQH